MVYRALAGTGHGERSERRELIAENRKLYQEKEALLRKNGALRERLPDWRSASGDFLPTEAREAEGREFCLWVSYSCRDA